MPTFIIALLAAAAAQADRADRTYEGNWYVMDDTDNNTGERKVSAFQSYLKAREPDYVTLRMRCSGGKPTLFVEWEDLAFPDQAVVTFGPVTNSEAEPAEEQYVFAKSADPVERGLRASPQVSSKIVSAIGEAKYVTVTAHIATGIRTVGIEVDGTQRAWSRVSRHCPAPILPRPPL